MLTLVITAHVQDTESHCTERCDVVLARPRRIGSLTATTGLTQAATAMRLGVTQQTLSALERNAAKVSVDRLLEILSILGVELVLRDATESPTPGPSARSSW